MKNKVKLLILVLASLIMLGSCGDQRSNSSQTFATSSKSREDLIQEELEKKIRDVSRFKDNETPYQYLSTSELTFEQISKCTSLSQIPLEYENKFFRETDDKCYAICSLEEEKLCYVFLRFSGYTGITYYIEKCVQYPSDDIDSDFYDSILEIDYPENILSFSY